MIICYLALTGLLWGVAASTCVLPTEFDCDQSDPYCSGADKIEVEKGTLYDCDLPLVLNASRLISVHGGTFSSLSLQAPAITIQDITVGGGMNVSGIDDPIQWI
jgi:hypothetical protein